MESIIKINGEFYCEGNRRSKEYPEAKIFYDYSVFPDEKLESATSVAFRLERSYKAIRKYRKSDPPTIIEVYSNYGLENQHLDLRLEA